jgi:hypothetical protein
MVHVADFGIPAVFHVVNCSQVAGCNSLAAYSDPHLAIARADTDTEDKDAMRFAEIHLEIRTLLESMQKDLESLQKVREQLDGEIASAVTRLQFRYEHNSDSDAAIQDWSLLAKHTSSINLLKMGDECLAIFAFPPDSCRPAEPVRHFRQAALADDASIGLCLSCGGAISTEHFDSAARARKASLDELEKALGGVENVYSASAVIADSLRSPTAKRRLPSGSFKWSASVDRDTGRLHSKISEIGKGSAREGPLPDGVGEDDVEFSAKERESDIPD